MKFVAIENTPGYLPEDLDPATFDTLEEARSYALDLAGEAAEAGRPGTTIRPTNPDCIYVVSDEPHDLGRVIKVMALDG